VPVASGARDATVHRSVSLSGLRVIALLGIAVLLAHVHPRHRPATVCLLRAVTGIPCPFCGGTTAAVQAGRGDLVGALRASPLAVAAAPVVALLPMLNGRLAWPGPRARLPLLGLVLLGSELWQLHRFGWF
jgi:hypothetical protein